MPETSNDVRDVALAVVGSFIEELDLDLPGGRDGDEVPPPTAPSVASESRPGEVKLERLLWRERRGFEDDRDGDGCDVGESWVVPREGGRVDVDVDGAGEDGDALDREIEDAAGEILRGLGCTPSNNDDFFIAEVWGLAAAEGVSLAARLWA